MNELVQLVESTFQRDDIPDFSAGDTVNVHVRIREGEKERIQVFKGIVLQRKGHGATETVTVRKETQGIGVERIIPIHSPSVDKIEVVKRGKVRRARIYYMRGRSGKRARITEDFGYRPKKEKA